VFLAFAEFVHPAFALGCIPWLMLAYLTFRIGIFPSSEGVLVRNVLRSRRIRWDEIERFDWGTWSGFPIGGVYLRDGRFVRAFALNPPFELKRGVDKAVPGALAGAERRARTRAGGWIDVERVIQRSRSPCSQQLGLGGDRWAVKDSNSPANRGFCPAVGAPMRARCAHARFPLARSGRSGGVRYSAGSIRRTVGTRSIARSNDTTVPMPESSAHAARYDSAKWIRYCS